MREKQKNFISCVVYLHNEANTIERFLETTVQVLKDNFEKYEIICVNDASDDETVDKLKEYLKKEDSIKSISLVNMSYFQGIEVAMNAGRDLAVGDFVFEFDMVSVDYDADLIMKIYYKALEGYDIVAATPKYFIPLSSKLFYAVYNWGNKASMKLRQERFRFVSRRAINRVNQLNTYIPYRKATYVKCGLRFISIDYDNKRGEHRNRNKQERGSRNLLAFDSFIIFTDILERISLLLCVAFLIAMLVMAGYVIWSVFSAVRPVEGWMSIMGLISFGFFGVFLLLTLILKYLSVVLNISFKKQRYVIEGVEKL